MIALSLELPGVNVGSSRIGCPHGSEIQLVKFLMRPELLWAVHSAHFRFRHRMNFNKSDQLNHKLSVLELTAARY